MLICIVPSTSRPFYDDAFSYQNLKGSQYFDVLIYSYEYTRTAEESQILGECLCLWIFPQSDLSELSAISFTNRTRASVRWVAKSLSLLFGRGHVCCAEDHGFEPTTILFLTIVEKHFSQKFLPLSRRYRNLWKKALIRDRTRDRVDETLTG